MVLGTPDVESSTADPTIFLQLAISKEGVIAGTVNNTETEKTQSIEGMVDKKTQRTAWVVTGKTSPIMETGLASLTPREREVLRLIAEGLSGKEIAATLGVSAKTIETHRSRIMEKLGIHKVSGLVRFAVRAGLCASFDPLLCPARSATTT